jgi:D-hydroxyproline dehydrogenase subunit beta
MKSFDVVVVGAGIVGCGCASECARAGLSVAVVESRVPGSGATAAGMGHLVVMDDSPAQLALTHYSRSLWQELIAELPSTVEYEGRGTLWVAADEEEMAEVIAKKARYAEVGVASEVLDGAQVAAEEPNLRPSLAGGLLVPEDGVIYPPTAAKYFLDQACALGAVCFQGSTVVSAFRGEVWLTDGTVLRGKQIILATGADTSLLPAPLLKSRKGHLLITDRYPDFLRHQLVELGYLKSAHSSDGDSVAFNAQPRRTGQILIGSSRQYGAEHTEVDAAMLSKMYERARLYMPGLARLSMVRAWTGFRAATDDNLPMIGPVAAFNEDQSLWLAVGFEGLGITNAPGAARLLVDQMLGRPSAIDSAPYLPERALQGKAMHA